MKRFGMSVSVAILAVVLAGCMGATPIRPVSGPDASVAYGNISIPDRHITNVMLYKVGVVYAPPFKSPPHGHTYTNGNFFFENLEPGQYYLVGFMSGQDAFYFNYQGIKKEEFVKKVAIEIKPGAATYLGSYKVTGIERNFLSADKFDIKPSQTPTRSDILIQLQEAAKGTGWDTRFANAMSKK